MYILTDLYKMCFEINCVCEREKKRERGESQGEENFNSGYYIIVWNMYHNLINYFLNLLALKCISSIYLEESFREHFMAKRNFKAFYLHYYTEFLSIPFFPSSILLFFLHFFPSSLLPLFSMYCVYAKRNSKFWQKSINPVNNSYYTIFFWFSSTLNHCVSNTASSTMERLIIELKIITLSSFSFSA